MKYRKKKKLTQKLFTALFAFAVLYACGQDDKGADNEQMLAERLALLEDSWVTPQGTYGLDISGTAYRFWAYQKAEYTSTFTLDPNEPDDAFTLNIGNDERIADRSGQPFCRITDMHYENGQIILHLIFTDNTEEEIILVTSGSIEE